LQHIIQDLLDYAQIRSGKFRQNCKNFDIKDTVNDIIKLQLEQAKSHENKLEAVFINLETPKIFADKERI
jgi:signal transduction histidine kinase